MFNTLYFSNANKCIFYKTSISQQQYSIKFLKKFHKVSINNNDEFQTNEITSPYETLGLKVTADSKQIKAAYRKLALKYHPDRKEGSETKFLRVLRAYEILIGKNEINPYDKTDPQYWKFHDWYWTFSSRKREEKQNVELLSKEGIASQMAGLRHRAAIKKQKSLNYDFKSNFKDNNEESISNDVGNQLLGLKRRAYIKNKDNK